MRGKKSTGGKCSMADDDRSPTIEIFSLEEKYAGMAIDMDRFLTVFEPNGAQATDYRYYLSEDEDIESLSSAYEHEDPRAIDYPPEDDDAEERYLDLPYPALSLFAEIQTDKKGNTFLSSLSICKVYPTGCITPGAHSSVLITAEADRIDEILSSVGVERSGEYPE